MVATCKHFMGYSLEGAEGESRFSVDATISPQDAADTYLPAFEACVQEGGAQGVMCSYNAVNGVPSCANEPLLRGKLRGSWGFGGYVVTDCGAVMVRRLSRRIEMVSCCHIKACLPGDTRLLTLQQSI